jgi:hypothetical protein
VSMTHTLCVSCPSYEIKGKVSYMLNSMQAQQAFESMFAKGHTPLVDTRTPDECNRRGRHYLPIFKKAEQS